MEVLLDELGELHAVAAPRPQKKKNKARSGQIEEKSGPGAAGAGGSTAGVEGGRRG